MRGVVLAMAFAVAAGCASAPIPVDPPPEIRISSVEEMDFLIDRGGSFETIFEIEITNPSAVALQLVRVELQALSAPFTLRQRSPNVGVTIEPGETRVTRVPVLVTSRGGIGASDEPSTVRALLLFHSEPGNFRKIVPIFLRN